MYLLLYMSHVSHFTLFSPQKSVRKSLSTYVRNHRRRWKGPQLGPPPPVDDDDSAHHLTCPHSCAGAVKQEVVDDGDTEMTIKQEPNISDSNKLADSAEHRCMEVKKEPEEFHDNPFVEAAKNCEIVEVKKEPEDLEHFYADAAGALDFDVVEMKIEPGDSVCDTETDTGTTLVNVDDPDTYINVEDTNSGTFPIVENPDPKTFTKKENCESKTLATADHVEHVERDMTMESLTYIEQEEESLLSVHFDNSMEEIKLTGEIRITQVT